MFSVRQKREIADAVQNILRATNHPELPIAGEIRFKLRVEGAEDWSWAVIVNNGAVAVPGINPWNERQDAAISDAINMLCDGQLAPERTLEALKILRAAKAACSSAPACSPRFVVVSDLPEWTVWDQERKCDLFPTKSGNRDYACRRCSEHTAHLIADALNAYMPNAAGQTPAAGSKA